MFRRSAGIDAADADVTSKRHVRIDGHGSFNRQPKPIDAGAARLFDLVKRSGADLGLDIGWRDTGGVCDGNNIAEAGVPGGATMGARGGGIHSPDAFQLVDSPSVPAALSGVNTLRTASQGGHRDFPP